MEATELLNEKNREYYRILSLVILLKKLNKGLSRVDFKLELSSMVDTYITQGSIDRTLTTAMQLGLMELKKGVFNLTEDGINFADNCSNLIDM